MKKLYIILLILSSSFVSASFIGVNGGRVGNGTFFSPNMLVTTPFYVLTTTINCDYQDAPRMLENNLFICQLDNAYGKTFSCNGIAKDPDNDNVLSISPDVLSVKNYGNKNGFDAYPAGSTTQYVKVLMPSDRLRRGEATKFEVKCVSNLTASTEQTFSAVLVPQNKEPEVITEAAISVKNNAGYYVMAFFGLVIIGFIGVFLWRAKK